MVHSDFREKIVLKYNTIIKNRDLSEKLENAIYNWCLKDIEKKGMTISDPFYKMYMNKNIHIFTNINPKCCIKNTYLLEKIMDGSISMEEVPELSPQKLFPDHWKALQDKQKAQDEFLYLKKPEAATDEFKCSKCKQRKCTYYELQTRSIDEPMTKFIRCLVCENRWRMSA